MPNVLIDEKLYKKITQIVKNNSVDYPSINNFVNKAVKKLIGLTYEN